MKHAIFCQAPIKLLFMQKNRAWVIVYRKSREPWLVTMSLEDFIKIIKQKGE